MGLFFFFFLTFCFETIFDLQKSCETSTENSLTCFTQLPLMLTSYLTTVHLSKLVNQQRYNTINFSTDLIWILPTATLMSFFWSTIKFRIQHCVYLSCLLSHIQSMTVHQSFCVFMTLTLLKTTGQLFCSIPSIWFGMMFSHD